MSQLLTERTGHTLPTRTNRRLFLNRGIIAETGVLPTGYHLLQDSFPFVPQKTEKLMTEDINGKPIPIMRVAGLFQESDIRNANGRRYGRELLATATDLIQADVGARAVYGEFDHPADAKIHLDRVSHLVTKAWMDGRKVYGEAEVLDNQIHGRALRGLFERKCRVGISSRGIGDMEAVNEGGEQYHNVLPGYQFVTWDAVAEPSVHGATLNIIESIQKRTKRSPMSRRGKRQQLLEQPKYEEMLLEEVSRYFNIEPIT